MLTLSNFTNEINETIVKRGRAYFRKAKVRELEEVDDGVWRALVEGSAVYDTTITIEKDVITDHRCSCPYDLGQYCKHEVAVLYAIREHIAGDAGDEEPKRPMAEEPPKKSRTVRDQVGKAISTIGEQKLRDLVIAHALEDQTLRRRVLRAAPSTENEQPSEKRQEYIDMIRACMEDNSDRHGFIGWHEARSASEAARELYATAEQHLASGRYAQALPIGQALLESIYPDLGTMDDSNGEFGGCIEEGWNILRSVADKTPPMSDLGREIFDYCLDQAGRKEYDGWSTEDKFLTIAGVLVHDDAGKDRLFDRIDRVLLRAVASEEDDDLSDWHRERHAEAAARIKLHVLRTLGKNTEADALVASSLEHPDIRKVHLQELFTARKFNEMKPIAKEGIALANKKEHPGTAHQFEEWLLKIADAEKDIPAQRKLLRKFFLDYRHDPSDYEKLKRTYSGDTEAWQEERVTIAAALKKQHALDSLLSLHIAEEQWSDVLACVTEECRKERHWQGRGNIGFLERYEKVLRKHFPEELVTLYAEAIPDELTGHPSGRGHYQEVCRALRRLRKWGAEEIVRKIKDDLCKKYGNRRALLDELSRV